MALVSSTRLNCPACGLEQDVELVRSLNTRAAADLKRKLLAGQLNLLVCRCGRRSQLAADLLFHDPDANYFCQVCVGDEAAFAKAAQAFASAGATGEQRLVPSLNSLVEKVKVLDAGLQDWAIEMVKVLLLAATDGRDLNRVVLFDGAADGLLSWVLFDGQGQAPRLVTSPLAAYQRGLATWAAVRPARTELRIDRAWAVDALQRVVPLPV